MDETIERMIVSVRADTQGFARDVSAMREGLEGGLGAGADRAGRAIEAGLMRALRTGRFGFEDLRRVALSVLDSIAASAIRGGLGALGGLIGGGGGGLLGLVGGLIGGAPAGFVHHASAASGRRCADSFRCFKGNSTGAHCQQNREVDQRRPSGGTDADARRPNARSPQACPGAARRLKLEMVEGHLEPKVVEIEMQFGLVFRRGVFFPWRTCGLGGGFVPSEVIATREQAREFLKHCLIEGQQVVAIAAQFVAAHGAQQVVRCGQ